MAVLITDPYIDETIDIDAVIEKITERKN